LQETNRSCSFSLVPFFVCGILETRRHGDIEIWRHADMEMETVETWRHGNMEKWRYGDMETWIHGHRNLTFYTHTKIENGNRMQRRFSLINLPFVHLAN
jgi:hypothetical protein